MAQLFKKSLWLVFLSIVTLTILVVIIANFLKLERPWLLALTIGVLFPTCLTIYKILTSIDKEIIDNIHEKIDRKADEKEMKLLIKEINDRFLDHLNNNTQQFANLKDEIKSLKDNDIKGVKEQVDKIYNLLLKRK